MNFSFVCIRKQGFAYKAQKEKNPEFCHVVYCLSKPRLMQWKNKLGHFYSNVKQLHKMLSNFLVILQRYLCVTNA